MTTEGQVGKLAGKVAMITGSAAGIGRAASLLFAKEGAIIAAVDCDAARNAALVEEIRSQGGSAEALTADVASAQDVERVVQQTGAVSNRIDILFNNAGIVAGGKVHTLTEEDWDRSFAINVKSMFLFSRAVVPWFLKQGDGVILNTSSTTALRAAPDRALYTATKGAIFSLTKSMALDYAADRIRVNCLCPGTTDTPSLRARLSTNGNSEEKTKQFIARQPLGRLGTAEEIARAALYLCSDEASFVTGTALQIDGGMSL
ncbi:MAG: glucose 1-dehydrogenase [Acidobacteriaceae bacterium]